MVPALLFSLLIVALSPLPGVAGETGEIRVADGAVTAKVDGCAALLTAADATGERSFQFEGPCGQDTIDRVRLFARMVAAAAPSPADRQTGLAARVASLAATFPEFAQRLAVASTRSTEWHGERALRNPRFASETVVRLANTPPIYRELSEALRPIGLNARVADARTVVIGRSAETPFEDWLASRGVEARRLVPYDAEVVFRLRP